MSSASKTTLSKSVWPIGPVVDSPPFMLSSVEISLVTRPVAAISSIVATGTDTCGDGTDTT